MSIQWKENYREDKTLVSERKIWESECERYKVVYSHLIIGGDSMPDRFYAIEIEEDGSENIIKVHYKQNPAFESCEKHYRESKKNVEKNRVRRTDRR